MERYQIRIEAGRSLEDVLAELTDSVWSALSKNPETRRFLTPKDKKPLKEGLRKVFSRFIVSHDMCGLESVCDEALEPAPWNRRPDPKRSAARHPWQAEDVRRLGLVVENGLEDFVDAVEAETFREIFSAPERAPLAKPVRTELGEAIRASIGPYLYHSVVCGMAELCRQAAKTDPWR